MKISADVSVSGLFKSIEVLDKDGNVKKTYGGFSNIITDIGLQRMAGTSDFGSLYNYCRVGTGTSTPAATNTQLDAQIGVSANTANGVVSNQLDDGYHDLTLTYTFAVGAVVGNISELATGWAASGINTVFSRALIRDGNGNPTSITILADEILRVTWSIRRYWPTVDFSGVLTNTGNKGGQYSWFCRAAGVGRWTYSAINNDQYGVLTFSLAGTLYPGTTLEGVRVYPSPSTISDITGVPSGSPNASFSLTQATKTHGVIGTLKFSAAQGVFPDGIKTVLFSARGRGANVMSFQIEFTPAILKTDIDLLEIDLEINWARR